jgi:hypothetical protein
MRKERTVAETAVNVSRVLDVGTVGLALVVGGPIAVLMLEGVVLTSTGTEMFDAWRKRRKNK